MNKMTIAYEGPCTNCGGRIQITDEALVFHSQPPCESSKSPPEDVPKIREILAKVRIGSKIRRVDG